MIDQEWLHLDPHTFDFTEAPRYRKTAIVTVRTAYPGEPMQTVLADGLVETRRTLQGGEKIITNPTGEEYAIRAEQFDQLYRHIEGDRYQSLGIVQAIPNPTGQPIRIIAPWNEWQYGKEDCWLAQGINPTDRYIIAGAEFFHTYRPLELVN